MDACAISVASNGAVNTASVQVLTEGGDVYETTCTLTFGLVVAPFTPPSLACTEVWTPQVTPELAPAASGSSNAGLMGVVPSEKGRKHS